MPLSRRLRLLAPFAAGAIVLLLSLLALWTYYQGPAAGLSGFVADGLHNPTAQAFARRLVMREVLPLYLGAGILLWLATLGWGLLLDRGWAHQWGFGTAFGLTLAGLGWIHLVLWWRVPSALWVIPVVSHLPFALGLPLLALVLAGPVAYRAFRHWGRRAWLMVPGWLLIWSLLAQAPLVLGRRVATDPPGHHPVKALLVGVDALRPDVAEAEGMAAWQGTHYPNAYTMVPATRLFYSLLWGGDPAEYSIGNALPSEEELNGQLRYALLDGYKAKGLKVRFYIDDGGTIGLAGRGSGFFDEVAMPAAGWENFVNSNLAVHLPFYASWMDALRVFPSTNPWAGLDAGLREALERGRGADLVMFHTCHLHQPIFLSRSELEDLPRWWTLKPLDLRPVAGLPLVTSSELANTDPRRDPLVAYRIRVRHLLAAWKPLWEGLARDPDYAQATRVLFSDHGERFYHVTPEFQLQGIHGYDLDPWELRIPFLVAGPGFSDGPGTDRAVGTLELRDALAEKLLGGKPITQASFGARPFAAVRYHTIRADFLRPEPEGVHYLSYDSKKIVQGAALLPHGVWVMRYQATLAERQHEVSVARAEGDHLDVYKPLEGGGAHHFSYRGYRLEGVEPISQADFEKVKAQIDTEYLRSVPDVAGR
jgi:hypothetical protein